MKKKVLVILSYILVAALASGLTFWATVPERGGTVSKLEQLEGLILERFIGEADRTALEDAAAEARIAALDDRWSYYIPASEYAAYMEQMENAYVGVGITIQLSEDGSGFDVLDVVEGGPAQEAGIQVGDVLVAIEGFSTDGMTTAEGRDLVRGTEGTYVEITISRNGSEKTLEIQRRSIKTPVATGEMLRGNIGYITIANFDLRCYEETVAAIEDLLSQGAVGLIFDVRANPGGYAYQLVDVLDYLLPEGELFRTVDYTGKEDVDYSDADCLRMPMAVLVNGDSYSAAEFFGAAMQIYDAAVIVGEQTVGKGHFQVTTTLNDGSAVALSIGKYFTPTGENLEGIGVTPDLIVPVDEETRTKIYYGQLPREEDPQLQAALELLLK